MFYSFFSIFFFSLFSICYDTHTEVVVGKILKFIFKLTELVGMKSEGGRKKIETNFIQSYVYSTLKFIRRYSFSSFSSTSYFFSNFSMNCIAIYLFWYIWCWVTDRTCMRAKAVVINWKKRTTNQNKKKKVLSFFFLDFEIWFFFLHK